jgi:hypothetical protein
MSVEFRKDIQDLINRHSVENGSDTPDFILARFLADCLEAFDSAVRTRDDWYGHKAFFGESKAG